MQSMLCMVCPAALLSQGYSWGCGFYFRRHFSIAFMLVAYDYRQTPQIRRRDHRGVKIMAAYKQGIQKAARLLVFQFWLPLFFH